MLLKKGLKVWNKSIPDLKCCKLSSYNVNMKLIKIRIEDTIIITESVMPLKSNLLGIEIYEQNEAGRQGGR